MCSCAAREPPRAPVPQEHEAVTVAATERPEERAQRWRCLDPALLERFTKRAMHGAVLEDFIRVAPEQYLWNHRKFKGRPAPLPDLYAKPPK